MRTISFVMVLLLPLSAAAAEPPNWAGAGIWSRPAYDGAAARRVEPIPMVSYYAKPWFVRTTHDILEGGARTEPFTGLALGAQLAAEGGRRRSDSAFLASHNVQDISAGISWGLHAELNHYVGPMPVWLLVRYRQNANPALGAQTDLRLTAGVHGGERLKAALVAQATWADRKSAQSYYGITPQQSASTGLATFTAGAGHLYNAEGLLWSFDLARDWLLLGSLEARQLQGNVRSSPLVQVHSGYYVSLGIAWQFRD